MPVDDCYSGCCVYPNDACDCWFTLFGRRPPLSLTGVFKLFPEDPVTVTVIFTLTGYDVAGCTWAYLSTLWKCPNADNVGGGSIYQFGLNFNCENPGPGIHANWGLRNVNASIFLPVEDFNGSVAFNPVHLLGHDPSVNFDYSVNCFCPLFLNDLYCNNSHWSIEITEP
jgi:hypothetical protein